MNTKYKIKAVFFTIAIIAIFSSCTKDDNENEISKPVVNITELGYENSKIGYAGTDLHIEAEIVAEGKIDRVQIEIHPEGEHEKSIATTLNGDEWEFDTTYTEFSGLKNTTFHKHIEIPLSADTGHYHFHFIVIDMEGNSTTIEEELSLVELVDTEAPVITITSAPANGESFANGETISISGSITDNISLAGMVVALVYESDSIADDDVDDDNPYIIVLLHTHDFGDDPDETDFSATINVGAEYDNNMTPALIQGDNAWKSGNYYILVKSKDLMDNWAISDHYPIKINY